MSPPRPVWVYWAVFGLAVTASAAVVGAIFLRLERSYALQALTRVTLIESLVLTLGALCLLLVAGWAFANRPPPAPQPPTEGYTYH